LEALIKSNINSSAAAERALHSIAKEKSVTKGAILIRQGQVVV